VYLHAFLSVCLPVCLSVQIYKYVYVLYSDIYLSIYLSIDLHLCIYNNLGRATSDIVRTHTHTCRSEGKREGESEKKSSRPYETPHRIQVQVSHVYTGGARRRPVVCLVFRVLSRYTLQLTPTHPHVCKSEREGQSYTTTHVRTGREKRKKKRGGKKRT